MKPLPQKPPKTVHEMRQLALQLDREGFHLAAQYWIDRANAIVERLA